MSCRVSSFTAKGIENFVMAGHQLMLPQAEFNHCYVGAVPTNAQTNDLQPTEVDMATKLQ